MAKIRLMTTFACIDYADSTSSLPSVLMESQKRATDGQHPVPTADPAVKSCRKKKSEGASFFEDVKDHIDEFIHASMDDHKTCFKKTIEKMFGMSKIVAERTAASGAKEVESSLPLQTTVSK